MAFTIPKFPVAQVAARSSPSVLTSEASMLPFVILALSFLLVLTSFLRRKLQQDCDKHSPAPSAFAYLFQTLLEPAEEVVGDGREATDAAVDLETPLPQPTEIVGGTGSVEEVVDDDHDEIALESADLETPLQQTTEIEAAVVAEEVVDDCHEEIALASTDLEATEIEAAGAAEEDVPALDSAEPEDLGWGCAQQQIYTKALLLCHRELAIRIARGPPGLEQESNVPERVGLTSRHLSLDEPVASTTQPAQQQLSLQDLQAMEAPSRYQKLLVKAGRGEPFHIHVNASQLRYQVYRDRVELKSLSWGGKTAPRLQDAWRQVCNLVAKGVKA
eukprot:gb/GFBE01018356.1/.p1 GENE.gb/GFBE01018356.1/~~gb/GFBE01018356.1/.p1  ORF type:complete len:331 (+),score=81.55 gb/GFBE01018356.1/:1-993(+)